MARMRLFGRIEQCRTLEAMLADGRQGRSRALVVRGESGIGKFAISSRGQLPGALGLGAAGRHGMAG